MNVRILDTVKLRLREHAAYFNELEKALEFVRSTPDLSIDEKKRFFKSANTNLGNFYSE